MNPRVLPLLLAFQSLNALEPPPGGLDLAAEGALQASASPEAGRSEDLAAGKCIVIEREAPGRPYAAQFTVPLEGGFAQNERVLAIVRARAAGGEGQGEVLAKLQLRGAPYTSFADPVALGIDREWTELPVLFVADAAASAGKASVVLLCAQRRQTIEVECVRVLKYPGSAALDGFPRAKPLRRTYPGREAGAPWREEALERIERLRKRDLSITLRDEKGAPLADAEVKLTLRRHSFGFGSAVVARRFGGDGEDDRRYRAIVDRLFSIVVFENDLKDGGWNPGLDTERRAERNASLDAAFAWLGERQIGVRGHYLMQVPVPHNLEGVADASEIRSRTLASVRERLAFVDDRVVEWDVINHPVAWEGADLLTRRPGLERLDREVFDLARSLAKGPFFVNEDQVFRPGPQCDGTFSYIAKLVADGYPVAGLGNQAHFHESHLPSPGHLLAVTDRFAKIVPRQAITEFDVVVSGDEELAADFTRDALIAAFSHPAYTGFLLWGFWEGAHWKPEAASWSRDWTIRPRGEVLEEWIGRRWRTEATLRTDAAGKVSWRGFPGWYEAATNGSARLVRAE